MPTPILVTGATGRTGSEVVRQLVAKGIPVRAFVRNADKAATLAGPDVVTFMAITSNRKRSTRP